MARARESERTPEVAVGAAPESPGPPGVEREVFTGESQLGPEFETVEVGLMPGSAYKWSKRPFPSHTQMTWKASLPGVRSELPVACEP